MTDAAGKPLYRNDVAGLEDALVQMPLLTKGEDAFWVNNQINAAGKPAKVQAKVGAAKGKVPAQVPRFRISGVTLGSDTDGVYATGGIANESKVAQKRLTIFCVARVRRSSRPDARSSTRWRRPTAPTPNAELRARRDALAAEVAELTGDLGGLTYEMAIRDHFRPVVLIRRAAALQERDAELGEVERLLAAADQGVSGACRSCGAPHSRGRATAGSAASP